MDAEKKLEEWAGRKEKMKGGRGFNTNKEIVAGTSDKTSCWVMSNGPDTAMSTHAVAKVVCLAASVIGRLNCRLCVRAWVRE